MKRTLHRLLILCLVGIFITNFASPRYIIAAPKSEGGELQKKTESFAQNRILVKFKKGVSEKEKETLKNKLELKTLKKYSSFGGELVGIRKSEKIESAVHKLMNDSKVEYAEPDYFLRPDVLVNDPGFNNLWGLNSASDIDIDAPEAWNITTGSGDIVVGIIDTGIDINHPDLAQNIWTNPGEVPGDGIDNDGNGYIDDIHGWDFYNNDNTVFDPADGDSHGTHVAGTIAALANNSLGVVGVSPGIKIMPLKFLGSGGGYTSDAISAIEYAKKMGIKVTNNSWGGGGYSSSLRDAINSFNGLFVAAAGNDTANTDLSPHYPSSYDCSNIISVAALESSGGLAYFSNFGASTVDIGAPGDYIYSTIPGSSYGNKSGTSMAAPHVTGVAALILSINPSLNPIQVGDIIKQSSVPTASLMGKTSTGGMVNAFNAVTAIKGAGPYVASSSPLQNEKEVGIDRNISLTYSEKIFPGDYFGNIELKSDGTAVEVSCSISDNILTVITKGLSTDRNYVLTIPAGAVKNALGEATKYSYTLCFTTVDTVAPSVVSTDPFYGETGVSTYKTIYMNFSEPIKAGPNFNGISINGVPVNEGLFSLSINGNQIVIYHNGNFSYDTNYKVDIPQGAVTDIKGIEMASAYAFSFTTQSDTDPPMLRNTSPYNGETDVPPDKTITIYFNENIKEGAGFQDILLTLNGEPVETIKYISMNALEIKPVTSLQKGGSYNVWVPEGAIVDYQGNPTLEPVSLKFTVNLYDIIEFPQDTTDGLISPDSPVIYMISSYEGKLVSYNLETKTSREISLGYMPVAIELGQGQFSNEIYVALNSQIPYPGEGSKETAQQSIAIFDKDTFELKDSISLGYDPFDISADRHGFVYVTPADGQWSNFISYNRVTKSQVSASGIRHQTYAKLHPVLDRIYTIDTDVSPRDFTAFNISVDGQFTDPVYPGGYDSPYHGDYPLNQNFAIDPDGKYIFNGSGVIFTSSPEKAEDMKYAGKLNSGFSNIEFGPSLSEFYTVNNDRAVNIYNGHDFSLRESLQLGGTGEFVFKQGSKLIVLLDQGNKEFKTGLQLVDIPDRVPEVKSTDPANSSSNVQVGKPITVYFSESVAPLTNYEGITIKDSSGSTVSSQKNVELNKLNILPEKLNYSTTYTVSISAASIQDMTGNTMVGDFSFSFTTEPAADLISPSVIGSDPADGAVDVSKYKEITILFSEDVMQGSTFENIILTDINGNTVYSTKFINENTVRIVPSALSYSTKYSLIVPAGAVYDSAGNAITTEYKMSFTTQPEPDLTSPTVISADPSNYAVGVNLNQVIKVTFSENILEGPNYNGISLKSSSGSTVSATKNISGNVLSITPAALNYGTKYILTIPQGALKDFASNTLEASYSLSFTTMAEPDTTAPWVISTSPLNGTTNISPKTAITMDFNENIQLVNPPKGGIKIMKGTTSVSFSISISGGRITLTPSSLSPRSTYTVTISGGAVKDASGNIMTSSYTFSFTTGKK